MPSSASWWIVAVFAGLGVIAFVLANGLQAGPTDAEILAESAVDVGNGEVEVRIEWSFLATPQTTEFETVRIPASALDTESVPIWRLPDGAFTLDDPTHHLGPGDYAMGAVLGALLGFVVVSTLRGYGYVRGTGEPGSMTTNEVREDRGFYWRS